MSKKFVHLRGAIGCGKTSIARGIVNSGGFSVMHIRVHGKDIPYTFNQESGILVTGRYDTRECGGMDGVIKNRTDMLDYLTKIIRRVPAKHIVFEAVMYGLTVLFAQEVEKICSAYGYEYVGICLFPPIEKELEWVLTRNNGKPINLELFTKQYERHLSSYKKLKALGFNVKAVDPSEISKENMKGIALRELVE